MIDGARRAGYSTIWPFKKSDATFSKDHKQAARFGEKANGCKMKKLIFNIHILKHCFP
jgi:hypothetical protein